MREGEVSSDIDGQTEVLSHNRLIQVSQLLTGDGFIVATVIYSDYLTNLSK